MKSGFANLVCEQGKIRGSSPLSLVLGLESIYRVQFEAGREDSFARQGIFLILAEDGWRPW